MHSSRSSVCVCAAAASFCLATLTLAQSADDDRSYRAGIGMLTKGLNDLAASEFRTYLREHAQGAQANNARYSLAVCLVRLGDHEAAANQLDAVLALKDFEFAPDALLLRAQCHLAAGDDAAAAAALGRLISSHPGFAQLDRAYAVQGESFYRIGKFNEAITALQSVSERWPQSSLADRADLVCAMSHRALANPAAAVGVAARLRARSPKGEYAAHAALIEAQSRHDLKDPQTAASLYARAADDGSGALRVEALLGLARIARSAGDFTRAEQALADAAKPAFPEGSGDLADRVALERGKLLCEQGRPEAAFKALSRMESSKSAPVAADAAFWAAKCEIKLGRCDAAAEHLQHAAAAHPKSELTADMLFERAAALAKAGKDGQSLDAWTQWRADNPSHDLAADAIIAQAWCAHRLGKLDEARDLCGVLVTNHPARAHDESSLLLVAENEFAADKFEPALSAYTQFLKHHPKSQHAWRAGVRRGLALARLDRDDAAAKVLEPLLSATTAPDAAVDPALRAAAMMTLADRAFAKQDWPKAGQWFARLAGESKSDPQEALLRQAVCIQREGRHADALPLFEQVIKAAPDSPQSLQAQFERGQSLVELGRLDEARAALEQVVASSNSRGGSDSATSGAPALVAHAQRHLASIASRQGRPEDAAAILSRLGSDGEPAGSTLLDLGSALLAAGKYADAERSLTRFIDSPSAAAKAPEARLRRAIAVNRQNRWAEALEQLESLGEAAALDPELRASAAYERGLALRSLGREPQAADAFKRLLQAAPSRIESYAALDLAQIESKADHHDEALKLIARSFSAAHRLEKAETLAIRERGSYLQAVSLLHLSKPSAAIEALKDFETLYPRSALLRSIHLLRGEALLATARSREAAEQFALAAAPLSADNDDAPDTRAAALLRLGEALAASQDWTRSDEAFTAYLDSCPQSAFWFQARFGQGWARENQGRHDAGIEAYRDIVARHQGLTAARAQFQIGECLYAQKKYEPAVAELLKTDVLFAYPEWSAAALYEAGRCLADMGRHEDATRQFDDLTKRFPDTQWAKLAAKRPAPAAPAPVPGRQRAAASSTAPQPR